MKYDVTFPYTRRPYYTITGIEASSKAEALAIARKQAAIEIPDSTSAKPQVKQVA